MIKVEIPKEWVIWARHRAQEMGALKNSITKGEGNVSGFLGEIIVVKHYGGHLQHSLDCDAVIRYRSADIKTKRCTSEPKMHYECTVAATSTHQQCDDYYFVRILEDMSTGWIVGYIPQRLFFENARFYQKGSPDPAKPEWTFKADCYNMTISDIQRIGGI